MLMRTRVRAALRHQRAWLNTAAPSSSAPTSSPSPPSPPPLGRSFLQRVLLDRFSAQLAEQRERDEIFLLERFATLALTLKSIVVPSEHPLNDIADHVRSKIDAHFASAALSPSPSSSSSSSRPKSQDDEQQTQQVLALISHLVADLAPAPSSDELLAQEKAKRGTFWGRLRNRLSFKRKSLTKSPANASTSSSTSDSSDEVAQKQQSPGEVKLRALLNSYWPLLSNYGATSLANTYVAYEKFVPSASPVRIARGYELQWQFEAQAALRCGLLRAYLARLGKAVQEGDIRAEKLAASNGLALMRLSDAVLRGTASERICEHLRLFDAKFSQGQLQDCFYILFEPEVEVTQAALMAIRDLHPDIRKAVTKFSPTYLLDRFELNVKSRCLFAWSDPDYRGFNQLSADLMVPLEDVIKSRRLYFPEGLHVGQSFANDATADRRLKYHDKRELNESLRNGAVFFAICIALDSLITNL